jgi:hypothetical protein
VTVSAADIDAHIRVLDGELDALRGRREIWAQAKVARFEKMRADWCLVRRDVQMTGMNGRRIE